MEPATLTVLDALIARKNETGTCWGCGHEIVTHGCTIQVCMPCARSVWPACGAGEREYEEKQRLYAAADKRQAFRDLADSRRIPRLLPALIGAPQGYAQAVANQEVTAWARNPTPPLLVLTGPTGTGKTWQSWGALRAMSREYQAAKGASIQRAERDEIRAWVTCGVLLIDDIGSRISPGAIATALELIDARIDERRPTIVTTNATFDDMASIEPRLASRMAAGKVIKMAGKDRRLQSTV